jgi:hypothetical protein
MCFILLLVCFFPDYENTPYDPPPFYSRAGAKKVATLAKGYLLSMAIRKGMSPEEVDAWLGKSTISLVDNTGCREIYHRYSIHIVWKPDKRTGRPTITKVEWVFAWN